MAKTQYSILAATLAIAGSLLLVSSETQGAVLELGQVKCVILVKFSEQYYNAHDECHNKMMEENKEKNDKEERLPYPFNATIEDFEWDDHCHQHCVYKTFGIFSNDDTLAKKTDTTTIFGKGKMSDDRYKLITSAWDDCLILSEDIGKKKAWDHCKIATHHDFCFGEKIHENMDKLEVDC